MNAKATVPAKSTDASSIQRLEYELWLFWVFLSLASHVLATVSCSSLSLAFSWRHGRLNKVQTSCL